MDKQAPSPLSDEDLDKLKDALVGTCDSLEKTLCELGLDVLEDIAVDRLLDGSRSVERCEGCEWWFESSVLEPDPSGKILCEQCWPEGFA
jgi:hypothetical protein